MNKELLLQVRQAILDHPQHFDMQSYFHVTFNSFSELGNCKTTACLAGWAIAIHNKRINELLEIRTADGSTPASFFYSDFHAIKTPEALAATYLKIPKSTAFRLFHINNWPPVFRKNYISSRDATDIQGMVQATVDFLDFFIDYVEKFGVEGYESYARDFWRMTLDELRSCNERED